MPIYLSRNPRGIPRLNRFKDPSRCSVAMVLPRCSLSFSLSVCDSSSSYLQGRKPTRIRNCHAQRDHPLLVLRRASFSRATGSPVLFGEIYMRECRTDSISSEVAAEMTARGFRANGFTLCSSRAALARGRDFRVQMDNFQRRARAYSY